MAAALSGFSSHKKLRHFLKNSLRLSLGLAGEDFAMIKHEADIFQIFFLSPFALSPIG